MGTYATGSASRWSATGTDLPISPRVFYITLLTHEKCGRRVAASCSRNRALRPTPVPESLFEALTSEDLGSEGTGCRWLIEMFDRDITEARGVPQSKEYTTARISRWKGPHPLFYNTRHLFLWDTRISPRVNDRQRIIMAKQACPCGEDSGQGDGCDDSQATGFVILSDSLLAESRIPGL